MVNFLLLLLLKVQVLFFLFVFFRFFFFRFFFSLSPLFFFLFFSLSERGHAVDGPPDPPRQLQVLGHDRHALGVDRAQVCVLEKVDDKVLRRLLEREQRLGGPAEGLRGDAVGDLSRLEVVI